MTFDLDVKTSEKRMVLFIVWMTIGVLLQSALVVSLPVFADEGKAEEIIVYGENIPRPFLDSNTSVNIQTAADIERSSDVSIQDVFKRTANVVATGTGIQSFDFSIRGINTDGVGGAGQEGLATIIIDGANTTRVQSARGISSLFDIESIEVLRGPQSTNQGKNSLAGAVIVTTKNPEFERTTTVRADYGEYNTSQFALAHTGPITDELAYRIIVDRQATDGFIENPVRGEDDYAYGESLSGRVKLLYAPQSIPLEILLSYTRLSSDQNNDIDIYDVENKRFLSLNPLDAKMDSDQSLTTLNMDYEFSDRWSLQSITTYNDFSSSDNTNAFAVTLPNEDERWKALIAQEEFTQELRLNYNGHALTGVIGLYYSDYESLDTRDGIGLVSFRTPFGPANVDIDFYSPTEIETKAVFGEVDYKLNDRLTLTAGFRYEQLRFDLLTDGLIVLQPFNVPFRDLTLEGGKDQDIFLPKLAVNYALAEQQKVGFTYSEGYRPGGVDLDIFGGSGVTQYESEHTKNYELSYKGLLLGSRLSVNANLFFIDWTDMQTSGSAQIRSGTFNAGESTVYGGEFETRWFPDHDSEIYFNIGYTKTNFDSFFTCGQAAPTAACDFTGNEFANSPNLTAAVGGYWHVGNFVLGAESSYRGSSYDDITNTFEVDSLTVANLSATWKRDSLSLKLYANNVFDRVISIRNTQTVQDNPSVEPQELGLLSNPRVVGLRVSYGF